MKKCEVDSRADDWGLLDAGFETASGICPEQGEIISFSSPHAQLQLGQCADYCGGTNVYAKK